jgi:hypothetical protein
MFPAFEALYNEFAEARQWTEAKNLAERFMYALILDSVTGPASQIHDEYNAQAYKEWSDRWNHAATAP